MYFTFYVFAGSEQGSNNNNPASSDISASEYSGTSRSTKSVKGERGAGGASSGKDSSGPSPRLGSGGGGGAMGNHAKSGTYV